MQLRNDATAFKVVFRLCLLTKIISLIFFFQFFKKAIKRLALGASDALIADIFVFNIPFGDRIIFNFGFVIGRIFKIELIIPLVIIVLLFRFDWKLEGILFRRRIVCLNGAQSL